MDNEREIVKANNPDNYETTDAQIRPLIYTGVVVLILMFGSFIGIIPLFKILDYYQPLLDEDVAPLVDQRVGNNAPRLQIDPPRQKYELAYREDEILNNYAWVDESVKIVRIPVDRAIELLGDGRLAFPGSDVSNFNSKVILP